MKINLKNIFFTLILMTFTFKGICGELKVAVLKYGSVNWELNVLEHHGLDKKYNLNIKKVQMTNKDAAAIAFLSGAVDVFVTDWIWVSKQ